MPITNKKKRELERRQREEAMENGRWQCPSCKAIHHFNSKRGCCNQKCSFQGTLERIR